MSLIELLPLLRGWEYDLEEITLPLPLQPEQEGGKMEIPYPGWLCWCMMKMDHPDAIAILRYHYIGRTYKATTYPFKSLRHGINSAESFRLLVSQI